MQGGLDVGTTEVTTIGDDVDRVGADVRDAVDVEARVGFHRGVVEVGEEVAAGCRRVGEEDGTDGLRVLDRVHERFVAARVGRRVEVGKEGRVEFEVLVVLDRVARDGSLLGDCEIGEDSVVDPVEHRQWERG